jgi:hypothetical protein
MCPRREGLRTVLRKTELSPSNRKRANGRQPAMCLTGMMQSYVIQFEGLPAAGTNRCPPRQPAFCVTRHLVCTLRDFLAKIESAILPEA